MKQRIDEMDILRGLSILGVLLIHITAVFFSSIQSDATGAFALFLNQASRFAVPVFIILSGWGLTISGKYKANYFQFLSSQILKIIWLYVLWNSVYYLFTMDNFSVMSLFNGIVFGTTYYHLYYVPVILFMYLIYPIMYKVSKSILGLLSILMITIVSQLLGVFTGIDIFDSPLNVFNWIFYFSFGIWFANSFKDKVVYLKARPVILVVMCVIVTFFVCIESYLKIKTGKIDFATTSMRASVIVLSISFLMCVISLKWNDGVIKKILLKLARASYGIYLSHALVLTVYQLLIESLGISIGAFTLIMSAFVVVTPISYVISILMDKIEAVVRSYINKLLIVK